MLWVTVGHGSHRNSGQPFSSLSLNIKPLTKHVRKSFIIKLFFLSVFRFSSDPGDNDCLIEMVNIK